MENFKIHFKSETEIKNIDHITEKLTKIVGSERISVDEIDRIAYGKDYWLISNLMTLKGVQPTLPDLIVWPKSPDEISQILKIANKYQIPVIPYGEGSGVVGGALAIHGGIILDMKYFDSIKINQTNMTVTVGTGLNGAVLERHLNEHGFRMGHIPQSIRTSTIGGYIAHRAAGQFSGIYGKMEDIVLSMEIVLPTGEIIKTKTYPRASVGPMVDRLFLGSEGTLGIVTEATCKIWPMPEKQGKLSYLFSDMQNCLDAIRETLQTRVNPGVIRIYDIKETERHFGETIKNSKGKIMLIFVFEGNERLVNLEMHITSGNCEKNNGIATGEKPVDHWFETRFKVSEASEFGPYNLVMDTIEVSCMWDKSKELYDEVIKSILSVPGIFLASGHASHFYTTGVCWYFTFSGIPKGDKDYIAFYNDVWDATIRTSLRIGGTASHHHGMGVNRSRWMRLEHGGEFNILQKIKAMLDPNNVMNPGKLYSEEIQKRNL
ncbi:FAD-binding oxidoreductase [Promethearchaeum syntrophicum]|uniref:FAD-binding oxidoreductase n=1 Tax=Promethearchaeum syntrophicum TaxID=2594042 RepID=A0A5B9DE95_9ARCH|nr:FAD-binding oxidoreductase [Candidatus Prometheoarchaeum syntrophicum]QEE17120.1 glycolate oxidase subunit GlcD [Candidatus Prometheoarchaeum syntrophicum]